MLQCRLPILSLFIQYLRMSTQVKTRVFSFHDLDVRAVEREDSFCHRAVAVEDEDEVGSIVESVHDEEFEVYKPEIRFRISVAY